MNQLSYLVGCNIRQKRKSLRINQESLALMSEIDRSYMGRIERGEVNITLDKLYQICLTLNCEPADILPQVSECQFMQK